MDTETKIYWFQSLTEGMDQSTDTSLTNGFPLLSNVTQNQVGNVTTRSGSDRLGASLGSNPGYGLFTYDKSDGTHKLMAVYDRDLYLYNEGTGLWGTIDTDEWVADKKVDAVNFSDRLYIGCESGTDPLCYTTGSSVTDITPTIGGNILAVNKDVLCVGGNSLMGNVLFYTYEFTDIFHSATGTCAADADVEGTGYVTATADVFEADIVGKVLYNTSDGVMVTITDWVDGDVVKTDGDTSTWDNDTIYVMANIVKIDGKPTALCSYQENFVAFDEWNMYLFDPATEWSSKIPGYGCVSNRTLKNVGGYLVWLSRDGIYMYSGEGLPTDITPKITDKVAGTAVMNLINKANYSENCAGVKDAEAKYFLSLGNLSSLTGSYVSGDTNVVMVLDAKTGNWTHRQYQDTPLAFTSFINSSGSKNLYAIHKGDAFVTRFDAANNTDDAASTEDNAVTVEVITPHRVYLDNPTVTNIIREYYFKYKAENEVTVSDSVDRGDFASLVTLPASSTVTVKAVLPTANREGYTHSLKFVTTGAFTLEAYGVMVEAGTTTYLPRL